MGGKPSAVDPVDDGALADAEPAGHFRDGQLTLLKQSGRRDVVGLTQVGDSVSVEVATNTCFVAGRAEPLGEDRRGIISTLA